MDLVLFRSFGLFKQFFWFVVIWYIYVVVYGDGYGDGLEFVQRNDEFEKFFDCFQIIYDIGYEEGMRLCFINKKLGFSLFLVMGVFVIDFVLFLGLDVFENFCWFEFFKIVYENGYDDGLRLCF